MNFVQSFMGYQPFERTNNPAYLDSIFSVGQKQRPYMLGTVASLVSLRIDHTFNPLLRARPLAEFQPSDFSSLLGECFYLQSSKGLLSTAHLEAVIPYADGATTSFTLTFCNPAGAAIVKDLYTVANTRLGLFELSVSQIAQNEGTFVAIAE